MARFKRARRGRPELTPEQRAEMRDRIAAAARRLFREEGYAAVSMRRLAAELGCTPMTLYAYYDAKIDILRHLWNHIFDAVFAKLEKIAAEHREPRRRLTAVAHGYVDYWLDHQEHYRIVFMTEGVSQADVSVFVADAPLAARFGVLLDPLAQLCADSGPAMRKRKADLLICGLHGIAHCLITISAYSWSKPQALVSTLVAGLTESAQ